MESLSVNNSVTSNSHLRAFQEPFGRTKSYLKLQVLDYLKLRKAVSIAAIFCILGSEEGVVDISWK